MSDASSSSGSSSDSEPDCDDRYNPRADPDQDGNLAGGGLIAVPFAHPGCTGFPNFPCIKSHPRIKVSDRTADSPAVFRDFVVCQNCQDHGLQVLQLQETLTTTGTPQPDPITGTLKLFISTGMPAPGANCRSFNGLGPRRQVPGAQAVAPAFRQTWQTPAEMLTGVVQPTVPRSFRHPKWLTRLCRKCERIEQTEARTRYEALFSAPGDPLHDDAYLPGDSKSRAPNMLEASKWLEYPWSTCTCHYWLGMTRRPYPIGHQAPGAANPTHTLLWTTKNPRICLSHRQSIWQQLVAKRDSNDLWLQNIHLENGLGTKLRRATPAEKLQRVQVGGYWRACRCGSEIDHFDAQGNEIHSPRILQCLACEGTRNFVKNAHIAQQGIGMVNSVAYPVADAKHIRFFKPANVKLGNGPRLDLGTLPPL